LLVTFALLLTTTVCPALYTLSLHDALPICLILSPPGWSGEVMTTRQPVPVKWPRPFEVCSSWVVRLPNPTATRSATGDVRSRRRSEEHTSELQSRENLVCRLLLEKKNIQRT